jgi:arginyl-tRNA synthetase
MSLQKILSEKVKNAITDLYGATLDNVEFQATRKEFEGDITVVVFPMLRTVKGNPVQIGEAIGAYLVQHVEEVKDFNVVKGFLNIVLNFLIRFHHLIPSESSRKEMRLSWSSIPRLIQINRFT